MTESDDIQIISESESIQEQIAALNYSIKLLKKKRDQLHRKLYINDWEKNEFANDTQTQRLAEFFHELNFIIDDLKRPESKSNPKPKSNPEYKLAKSILKFYEIATPFIKLLYNATDPFIYPTKDLTAKEENRLRNLCAEMEKLKWLSFERLETGLEISPNIPKKSKFFLNGGWAELANRFLIYRTLNDFASVNSVKRYNVFWNVKLREVGSKRETPDYELDIVVELNSRFYIFETKSGGFEKKKMLERAHIFDTPKSRYIVCNLVEKPFVGDTNEPFLLFPLPQLKEKLNELFSEDYANDSIIIIKSQSEKAFD